MGKDASHYNCSPNSNLRNRAYCIIRDAGSIVGRGEKYEEGRVH